MKTLQKYANIALFLISATAMIPAHADSTANAQEKIKQEEVIVKPQKTTKRILEYAKNNKAMLIRIAAACALLDTTHLTILVANKYNLYTDYPIVQLVLLQWIAAAALFIDSIPVSAPKQNEKINS